MSIKILLADDSITIQKVIGIIFGGEEYSLTVVDNGKAAVEKALEIIPDILLIDALMPGMSGYEVCEQVRATPALSAKPILLLTGSFEPFDETKAKNCGADDFISKPFESQQIITKVTELCELAASRSFAAVPIEEEPPALPEEPEHVEVPVVADQPEDIWEAFTPPEAVVEAPVQSDEEEVDLSETQAKESDHASWTPVEEQTHGIEEQAAADLPVEAVEEGAFGDISLAESGEPAVESEEPVEEEISAEELPKEGVERAGAVPTALTEEQLRAAIAGVSKDVIERIVWEVVPDLAETLIKEAIRKIREGQ